MSEVRLEVRRPRRYGFMGLRLAAAALVLAPALGCRTLEQLSRNEPVPSTWTRLESAHFALSTATPSTYDARQMLPRLERFYTLVGAYAFHVWPLEREPMTIVASSDARVMPLRNPGVDPLAARGYPSLAFAPLEPSRPPMRVGWEVQADQPLVVVEDLLRGEAERCLRREIVRRFVSHQMPDAPAWLREGLAEFWGDLRINDTEVAFGRAAGFAVNGPYGRLRTELDPWKGWYIAPIYDVPVRDYFDVVFEQELREPSWLDCETGYRSFGPRPGFAEAGQPDPSAVDVLMGAPNRPAFLRYLRALTQREDEPTAFRALLAEVGETTFMLEAWAPFTIQRLAIAPDIAAQVASSGRVALAERALERGEEARLEGRVLTALGGPAARPVARALLAQAPSSGPTLACPATDAPMGTDAAWTVFVRRAPPTQLAACARALATAGRLEEARALTRAAIDVGPGVVAVRRVSAELASAAGELGCAEREAVRVREMSRGLAPPVEVDPSAAARPEVRPGASSCR